MNKQPDYLVCNPYHNGFTQLPMRSIYGNEISSLSPLREVLRFSKNHFRDI